MKESRKEFIKKAHSAACSDWKTNIEKEFPKLFKGDALVVGKWYNGYENYLIYITNIRQEFSYKKISYYGLSWEQKWKCDYIANIDIENSLKPATDKEVEEALIKEAKRRGFKKGVRVDKVNLSDDYNPNNELKEDTINTNELLSHGYLWVSSILIYDNGKWAEIVDTITKEQAEKELGKTILN